MSVFVYERDMLSVIFEPELSPSLPPHFERVAPGVDIIAPAFDDQLYCELGKSLSTHRYNRTRYSFTHRCCYRDSHGLRGRKPLKGRQMPGAQYRYIH